MGVHDWDYKSTPKGMEILIPNLRSGGSFVYAELLQYNQVYIDKIQAAQPKMNCLPFHLAGNG